MECQKATPLVEKLADGEATAEERAQAEAHLEVCETCRAHYAFLMSIAELGQKRRLPEPPEAYWKSMSRNVLARIAEEKAESAGNAGLRAPVIMGGTALRFAGLAAGVLLAAAVVWNVMLTRPRAPSSSEADSRAVSPQSAATPLAEQEEALAEPASPPAAAPPSDEPLRAAEKPAREIADVVELETAREPDPPLVAKSMEDARDSEASVAEGMASAAEPQYAARPRGTAVPSGARRARAAEEVEMEGGRASMLSSAPAEAEAVGPCESLRLELEAAGEGEGATDVRFELVRCELALYETESSEEARARAIDAAEAFLALEPEGSRAEEIRRVLSRVPR